jgi:CII-binding regulator of phage lambda lysogenization HflD
MNKRYLSIILGTLLVISLVGDFAFYDLWQQEKDKVSELKQKLNKANKQIEALNSNHEQEINKVAADFVERLFTYDSRVYENGREAALEMAIGEAKEKLVQQQAENLYDEFGGQDEIITSLIDIKDSVYNKTGNATATIIIKFEQELVMRESKTKTVNEIKLWIRYTADEWKIEDYEMTQII